MTKTNYQRVIEDIRAGRTELVWEEDKSNIPVEYFDALIDDDPSGEPAVVSFFKEEKERTFAVCNIDGYYLKTHPLKKYCNKKGVPSFRHNDHIFKLGEITLKETQAKIQQLYNDYLLEEARKKDERMAV